MSKWTKEQVVADSQAYFIRNGAGDKIGLTDEKSADDLIVAVNKEIDALEGVLRHIAETMCGIKVEGDIRFDMIHVFVEGQITKQEERADDAEEHIKRIAELFNLSSVGSYAEMRELIIKRILELQQAGKRPEPTKVNSAQSDAVNAFLEAWDGASMTQRLDLFAPFVKALRESNG